MSLSYNFLNLAGIAKKIRGGHSGHTKVRIQNIIDLNVSVGDLVPIIGEELCEEISHETIPVTSARSRTSATTWNATWHAIKSISEDKRRSLETLEIAHHHRPKNKISPQTNIRAYERDAFGFAAQCAGMDRRRILNALPSNVLSRSGPMSQLVDSQSIEDDYIFHDMLNMPEFRPLENIIDQINPRDYGQTGAHTRLIKKSTGSVLDVYNWNRKGLETATGADLVYHNSRYSSWTFIQYKMTEESRGGEYTYRPDGRFRIQLNRLREIWDKIGGKSNRKGSTIDISYRLSPEFCFFKLCYPTPLDPQKLTEGFYLPVGYLEAMIHAGLPQGPRGGEVITSKKPERHITNTDMANLVSCGWVGSSSISESQVVELIKQALSENRSVTLAHAHTTTQ